MNEDELATEFFPDAEQRREGLAYRLTWHRFSGVEPRKRVAPDSKTPTPRRKLIYRMRALITYGSHRVFRFARFVKKPQIYIQWARFSVALYHRLASSRGKFGKIIERLKLRSD